MADSQNTYQNDVKIKEQENKFGNTIVGVFIALCVIIGGYFAYDSQITASYEAGYEAGYDEAKVEEYNKGYKKGKEEGKKLGYSDGYSDGYNQGKEDAKSSSKGSSKSSSGSNNYSSGSSGYNNYSSSSNEKEYSYILNKNTDKFHYSWCNSVNQMKEKNKVYFNGTRSEAINKGYSPCGNCDP